MRLISKLALACAFAALSCLLVAADSSADGPPNVLIITVDDMSADSLGAFGCKLKETSPNIDAFAKQSLRFKHAHVQVGNCMPGRNIMWSGMFSHVNGVEGFVQNKNPDYPVLCDLAKDAGYFAAIRGKVTHSTPFHPYAWDAVLDEDDAGNKHHIKDAASYGASTRQGIALAAEAGKPFCLMVNISDPHKPFYAQGKGGTTVEDKHVPSRIFTAEEVPVPGFLPSDEVIRKELAHYYSSVRRADDCFAEVMAALDESGKADETFVLFLSDHGMPLPFAKTQLYHHSTHTPLMVRWPGVTKAGAIDEHHMVSAIDFLPTILEVMQHKHPNPKRLHGRSFAPILGGQRQKDRDFVILQYNENSGRSRHPMRGIQTREYLYLFNPWSDGQRKFATATTGTMTYRQMVKRAPGEVDIATRLELFDHRVLEEFYRVDDDPDCLQNLAGHTDHQKTLVSMREQLAETLQAFGDPVAPVLAKVENSEIRNVYMAVEDERTKAAKAARQKQKNQANPKTKRLRNAIRLRLPDAVKAGQTCDVVVPHKLPQELGEQMLQVTLKDGNGRRIERKAVTVSRSGKATVSFDIPADIATDTVQFAAFIGKEFQQNLQHVQSEPVKVQR